MLKLNTKKLYHHFTTITASPEINNEPKHVCTWFSMCQDQVSPNKKSQLPEAKP